MSKVLKLIIWVCLIGITLTSCSGKTVSPQNNGGESQINTYNYVFSYKILDEHPDIYLEEVIGVFKERIKQMGEENLLMMEESMVYKAGVNIQIQITPSERVSINEIKKYLNSNNDMPVQIELIYVRDVNE